MAQTADELGHETGSMNIKEQANTFQGFLGVTLWSCVFTAMLVSLLVVAFAMGQGWFAGLGAFVAVGAAAGLFLRMKAAFWAVLIALSLLLAAGGAVVQLAFGAGA